VGEVILRVWRGWTRPELADSYETLLREQIFPGIEARRVPGYLGITLGRRVQDDEVEFVTLMRFQDLDSVRAFAGEDYETAFVPPAAREVLPRYEERSSHYAIVEERPAPAS
jgi:antibiotic biosynthesis monooxygenase (ABM) superfamily enzyme